MTDDRRTPSGSRRDFVAGATGLGLGFLIPGAALHGSPAAAAVRASVANPPVGEAAVNVASYGIVGDGTTDHTDALLALMERLGEGSGASVLFPPGRYRVGGSLTIPRNVSLVLPRGAILDLEETLSIEGTLEAGLYEVFSGGRVRFAAGSLQWAFPQWWGALGDGEHDDTNALQSALSTRRVFLPAGQYRTTRELVLGNRATLVGVGNSWSSTPTTDSWIQYDGPVDDDIAVLRASTAPIGESPASALSSVHVEKVVLNGGNAAGYGLYSVYCTNDSSFTDVTVRHCRRHGVFVANQWYCSYRNIVARDNPGCGITIGPVFDGWRQLGVNGVAFWNIRAANNGRDGAFDETSNLRWGYGVLFLPNAGTDINHVVAENNYGPGLIFDLGSSCSNRISGGYLEGNGERALADGVATRPWGMVVIGHPNARANAVESLYLNGAVSERAAQAIWLTGREPTSELVLRDLSFGYRVKADWSRYRFEGHTYWGLSNYIEGHVPSSPAIVSSDLDTLYVAEHGSDERDGRSPERAFRTLERALRTARFALGVRTIVCSGATRAGSALDLAGFPIDRELTISGSGSADLGLDGEDAAPLHLRHALNKVTIRDFARVRGLRISACRDVTVTGVALSRREGTRDIVVVDGNSGVLFRDCVTERESDLRAPLRDEDVERSSGGLVRVSSR